MEQPTLTSSASETHNFGKQFSEKITSKMLLCLRGDLGSGKTTFTQGLLEGLGAEKPFISPTFVIMKQYDLPQTKNGIKRVYHIDAYRIEKKDLLFLGFEEWLDDEQGLLILEWPERVESLLPSERTEINFQSIDEEKRTITIRVLL